jgi:hypothetical protein
LILCDTNPEKLVMKRFFCLVTMWSTALVHAQGCRIAGQVFFANGVNRTITLKTDSGDLVDFNYDGDTSFLHPGTEPQRDVGGNRMLPQELKTGDRLCVGTSAPLTVTVTPRREIQAEQKKELAEWQADSLYGIVSEIDRKAQRITLEVSTGDTKTTHVVEVGPNAAYWVFPPNSINLSDAVTGSLEAVALGDALYVRGTKSGASEKFRATLIVSGGFRSFAATIETMEILDETLDVRLVLSGNLRKAHIPLGVLYSVAQVGGATDKTRGLYRIAAADLQPGDTVLILGTSAWPDSVRACALVAGFSPSGVLPPDPSQQMPWVFDKLLLGEGYSPLLVCQ